MVDGLPLTAPEGCPPTLARLLDATGERERDLTWEDFLHAYHKLILFAVRSAESDYDQVMDRYAFVLEHLREDDFRRLRSFQIEGKAKFSTWLVVVTRRLVIDHRRIRYGRTPDVDPENRDMEQRARRQLVDLVSGAVEVEQVMDATSGELDRRLREEEMKNVLSQALESLVPRDRLLLSLKYEDEMSGRQIAQIMGYESPFHVYRRLKVVLASLKEDLVKRGIDGSRP